MGKRVACLGCGHTYEARNDPRGKKSVCPQCGATDLVELVGSALAPELPPEAAMPEPAMPEPTPPASEPGPGAEVEPTAETGIPPWDGEEPAGEIDDWRPMADLSPARGRSDGGTRSLLRITAAAMLVGGVAYVTWLGFRPSDPAGSPVAQRREQEPAPIEQPVAPPDDVQTQPAEREPVEVVEPKWPGAMPATEFRPQPAMPEPVESMPVEDVEPEPAATEPVESVEPQKVDPVPREETKPESPPGRPVTPQGTVARSLDEAQRTIVKFELPLGIGDLTQYGAGFLVDSRGWVATNQHIASNLTTAARVRLAGGARLAVEGVLASASSRDLALVKLANPPKGLTILDIQYDESPALGEQVYAFGHPYQADFSLSKGIVSRVLTTGELLDVSRKHLVSKLGAPIDMVWIQHDAKTSPGNSGGPLIDQQGRVLGINTFVNLKAEFGYASHIRYLRELVAAATGAIEPPPPPREFVRTVVSTERMQELFEASNAFSWKPQTLEQYDQQAELAKQMTLAKHALTVRGATPGTSSEASAALRNVAGFADRAFLAMQRARWSSSQFSAINTFSVDQVDEVGQGVLLYGVVWASLEKPGVLVMAIDGTQKPVLVQVGSGASKFPLGSRWLVFGFVTPKTRRVNVQGQADSHPAHVLLSHYLLLVR